MFQVHNKYEKLFLIYDPPCRIVYSQGFQNLIIQSDKIYFLSSHNKNGHSARTNGALIVLPFSFEQFNLPWCGTVAI